MQSSKMVAVLAAWLLGVGAAAAQDEVTEAARAARALAQSQEVNEDLCGSWTYLGDAMGLKLGSRTVSLSAGEHEGEPCYVLEIEESMRAGLGANENVGGKTVIHVAPDLRVLHGHKERHMGEQSMGETTVTLDGDTYTRESSGNRFGGGGEETATLEHRPGLLAMRELDQLVLRMINLTPRTTYEFETWPQGNGAEGLRFTVGVPVGEEEDAPLPVLVETIGASPRATGFGAMAGGKQTCLLSRDHVVQKISIDMGIAEMTFTLQAPGGEEPELTGIDAFAVAEDREAEVEITAGELVQKLQESYADVKSYRCTLEQKLGDLPISSVGVPFQFKDGKFAGELSLEAGPISATRRMGFDGTSLWSEDLANFGPMGPMPPQVAVETIEEGARPRCDADGLIYSLLSGKLAEDLGDLEGVEVKPRTRAGVDTLELDLEPPVGSDLSEGKLTIIVDPETFRLLGDVREQRATRVIAVPVPGAGGRNSRMAIVTRIQNEEPGADISDDVFTPPPLPDD